MYNHTHTHIHTQSIFLDSTLERQDDSMCLEGGGEGGGRGGNVIAFPNSMHWCVTAREGLRMMRIITPGDDVPPSADNVTEYQVIELATAISSNGAVEYFEWRQVFFVSFYSNN